MAPLAFEVLAFVEAVNLGTKASAAHPVAWNGVDRDWVVPKVEVSVVLVVSAPQLVGLIAKLERFAFTLRVRKRSGTPPTIVGNWLEMTTRAVNGSTLMAARVTILPKS